MKYRVISILFFISLAAQAEAQYNQLTIPDTISGTTFDLTARDTFKQMISGNQTITAGINGNWWGPTLIWNKGDVVHITVHNQLQDTTTIHWHGMHLPAIMDGGPHQTIPPYTTWSPYWQVTNNAGLYWYHPHLHMEAEKQMNSGMGGLIIVRDSIESSLALPRTYGVDDIPIVLTDRKFDGSNQIVSNASFGDSMMVNGVLRPQYTLPSQVLRLRILDAATERNYNLGFSDNRNFYIITTDGGLLDTPVAVNRFMISPGERIEILLNLSGQNGTSFDLMAYNSALPQNISGGESFTTGPFVNYLGHKDFNILHLNVGAATSNAIIAMPTTLTTNTFYNVSSAQLTRIVALTDTPIGPGPNFLLNHHFFDMNTIDYTVPINNTEIWEINSTSTFGHPFHIHDVQFHIISRNGVAAPDYEQGWKDVVFVKAMENVQFITRFADYSDSLHPYMFHCHIALHEDQGTMGQFVVGSSPAGLKNVVNNKMKLYPNPGAGKLYFEMKDNISIAEAVIMNPNGQTVLMSSPKSGKGVLDVSSLSNGVYFIKLLDTEGQSYIKSYLKE